MGTFTRLFVAGLLLMGIFTLPTFGQDATVDQLLTGKTYPLTLKLKDLDGGWRTFTAGGQSDTGKSLLDMFMQSEMHMTMPAEVYYTKGQLVTMNGVTFLVAYRRLPLPLPDPQAARDNRDTAKPAPLTPDTPLNLCLMNLREVGNLINIHPFNMLQEIADSTVPGNTVTPTATGSESVANMRQLAVAVQMYVQDNKLKLPPLDDAEQMKAALMPYVKNEQLFLQPKSGDPYQGNPMLAGKTVAELPDPSQVMVLFEVTPDNNGQRVVAFLDGHVEAVDAQRWAALKEKMAKAVQPMAAKDAQTESLNRLRQLAVCIAISAQDNDEMLPAMQTAEQLKATLTKATQVDVKIFTKPGTVEAYQPNPTLSQKALGEIKKPEETILCYEATPWPDGKRGVAFLDGHVVFVGPQQWERLKAQLVAK